ncbi:MAG: hypothetical protein O7G84_09430, partial [Gammaproteobacteria bacterium]|nr:hypothetical protein [Gammaproteobacteria bacterium]
MRRARHRGTLISASPPALPPRTLASSLAPVEVSEESIMSSASRGLLISADAHVAENEDLRARLPEHLRERMPLIVPGKGGETDVETNGELRPRSSWKKLSARDRELEFRTDPSLGTDLDRRMRDMAREGVDAQVIFPTIALNCGGSHQTREYSKTFARAYNEYVREAFTSASKRFKPAAMIPT